MQTYRFLFSESMKAEGFTRVTWEIEKTASGFCRLTVTHELEGAPTMAHMVVEQVLRDGDRRMELDPQRPEVAARDREAARRLTRIRTSDSRRRPVAVVGVTNGHGRGDNAIALCLSLTPTTGTSGRWGSGKLALEIVASVRSRFLLRVAHDVLPGLAHAGDRRTPTDDSCAKRFAPCGTISYWRASGHFTSLPATTRPRSSARVSGLSRARPRGDGPSGVKGPEGQLG